MHSELNWTLKSVLWMSEFLTLCKRLIQELLSTSCCMFTYLSFQRSLSITSQIQNSSNLRNNRYGTHVWIRSGHLTLNTLEEVHLLDFATDSVLKNMFDPGIVAHTCSPSTGEAEAEESLWVQGSLGYISEFKAILCYIVRTRIKKKKKKTNPKTK